MPIYLGIKTERFKPFEYTPNPYEVNPYIEDYPCLNAKISEEINNYRYGKTLSLNAKIYLVANSKLEHLGEEFKRNELAYNDRKKYLEEQEEKEKTFSRNKKQEEVSTTPIEIEPTSPEFVAKSPAFEIFENFDLVNIPADGNCMYEAFRQGMGLQKSIAELREEIVNRLEEIYYKPEYSAWQQAIITDYGSVFQEPKSPSFLFGFYKSHIRKDKSWGSFLELQILKLIYPVDIFVWKQESPDSSKVNLIFRDNETVPNQEGDKKELHLHWNFNEDHYSLLVRKDKKEQETGPHKSILDLRDEIISEIQKNPKLLKNMNLSYQLWD